MSMLADVSLLCAAPPGLDGVTVNVNFLFHDFRDKLLDMENMFLEIAGYFQCVDMLRPYHCLKRKV